MFLAILFFILSIAAFGFFLYLTRDKDFEIGSAVIGGCILLFWFAICFTGTWVFHYNDPPEPQAIDVYRDLTTLQITYQDSIPTDTVVVFKK